MLNLKEPVIILLMLHRMLSTDSFRVIFSCKKHFYFYCYTIQ